MNWSKFKLKKICTVYQATDSYHFNDKHKTDSYISSIVEILTFSDLTYGVKLSGYNLYEDQFIATFIRRNPAGVDVECEIDFKTTTLTITVKE